MKKSKKRKIKKKKFKVSQKASFPTLADYFRDYIFETTEDWSIENPNNEIWMRNQIKTICNKSLSTQTIKFLGELYEKTNDVVMRGLLARKIYLLRKDYLSSYKEYSDRALILLAERKKLVDKWEGIYILGCFGGTSALEYLKEQLIKEKDQLLIQTIKRAIYKIEKGIEIKTLERGF